MRVLIDEDLPRSLAARIRVDLKFEAYDVRDVGLRGEADLRIFQYAVENGAALISRDIGFGNILRFLPGTHAGIVVVRLPNDSPIGFINDRVVHALRDVSSSELGGALLIVEADRIRIRRA